LRIISFTPSLEPFGDENVFNDAWSAVVIDPGLAQRFGSLRSPPKAVFDKRTHFAGTVEFHECLRLPLPTPLNFWVKNEGE
jgi:hypothetical protein